MNDQLIWQQVEFGSYEADLPHWVELAEMAGGPVLELGAGAGRVALHLAGRGHEVIAVERDADLAGELRRAAEHSDLAITVLDGDLSSPSDLDLRTSPALMIGPLHVIQVLDGAARPVLLARLRELIAPGGIAALTVVDESTMLSAGAASTQILPDMCEVDGWVYSSEPLWVQVGDQALRIRRLRERVSPDGRMERGIHDEVLNRLSPESLGEEAATAGFRAAGTRQINSGPNEADSTVVLLEAGG
ncbi:MAG: class I SAM-dependent methyltransferase [Solirubrobacterales bacterium]